MKPEASRTQEGPIDVHRGFRSHTHTDERQILRAILKGRIASLTPARARGGAFSLAGLNTTTARALGSLVPPQNCRSRGTLNYENLLDYCQKTMTTALSMERSEHSEPARLYSWPLDSVTVWGRQHQVPSRQQITAADPKEGSIFI